MYIFELFLKKLLTLNEIKMKFQWFSLKTMVANVVM